MSLIRRHHSFKCQRFKLHIEKKTFLLHLSLAETNSAVLGLWGFSWKKNIQAYNMNLNAVAFHSGYTRTLRSACCYWNKPAASPVLWSGRTTSCELTLGHDEVCSILHPPHLRGSRRSAEKNTNLPAGLWCFSVPRPSTGLLLRAGEGRMRLLPGVRARWGWSVRGAQRWRPPLRWRAAVRRCPGHGRRVPQLLRVRLLRPGVRQRREDLSQHLPPESWEQESRARWDRSGHFDPEGSMWFR